MIGLLRSDEPEPRTSPPRLRELGPLIESARAAGVEVRVDAALEELPTLPTAVDLTGYRIVQEALTNAVKHAPGTTVELSVRVVGEQVEITVTNPTTRPIPTETPTGTGVSTMTERAELTGGTLTAGLAEPGVWRVRARLPYQEDALAARAARAVG